MPAREALHAGVVVVGLRVDPVEDEHVLADGREEVLRILDRVVVVPEEELPSGRGRRDEDAVHLDDLGDEPVLVGRGHACSRDLGIAQHGGVPAARGVHVEEVRSSPHRRIGVGVTPEDGGEEEREPGEPGQLDEIAAIHRLLAPGFRHSWVKR